MSWENESHYVSTDPGLLDLDFVCAALAGSYWAQDRPRDVIARSIGASLCFGLYEKRGGRQVGFARVVTDAASIRRVLDLLNEKYHTDIEVGFLDPAVNSTIAVRPAKVISMRHGDFTGSPTRWTFGS